MTRVVLVDQNDNPIGLKERTELSAGDMTRASALWITNSRGDILLAQRAFSKKSSPGMWGAAVVGTVDEGEEYLDNAVKEASEELGLTILPTELAIGVKRFVDSNSHRFFIQWYAYVTDVARENLVLQAEEVADARWFTREELEHMIESRPHDFFGGNGEWAREQMQLYPFTPPSESTS